MMEGRPIKFRLLEIVENAGEIWNYEAVRKIQSEYPPMGSDNFFRDLINYDMTELQTSGFLVCVDNEIDTEGTFRKGALLSKYKMTQLGINQLRSLEKNPLKRRKT